MKKSTDDEVYFNRMPVNDDAISPDVYRQLYVALSLPSHSQHVIGVTSAIPGEGRTTVACGLAHTLAADLDTPVVLVEADLDRPSLATYFGITASPGLSEVLRGEEQFDNVMYPVDDNLFVIPAGITGPDAAGLLRHLNSYFPFTARQGASEVMILDLPSIMGTSYSTLAARAADTLVLVVRAGVTPADVVREAIARLEDLPPQGVVFNAPQDSIPGWWPSDSK